MGSGAVETRLRIWLSAWDRPLRAEALANTQNPHGFDVSGPFNADEVDRAEAGEPPEQLLVAALSRGEALDAEESSSFVQSCSSMDVEVRIDSARDASCQFGHCHPFVGLGWGDTAPSGTTDKTATGLYEAGSDEVTPSDRWVSSG